MVAQSLLKTGAWPLDEQDWPFNLLDVDGRLEDLSAHISSLREHARLDDILDHVPSRVEDRLDQIFDHLASLREDRLGDIFDHLANLRERAENLRGDAGSGLDTQWQTLATDGPAVTPPLALVQNRELASGPETSAQTSASLPVYTYDQIADQLVNGYWASTGVQWHAWNVGSDKSITVNITGLTAEGQVLARAALASWSDIIGVAFVEVSTGGEIQFDDAAAGANTDVSWTGNTITSAHVNISLAWLNNNGTSLGSYSYQTYLHEIGHALGLGHGGNYNATPTYTPTYSNDALYANDAWSTTVMSYFSQQANTYFANQGFTYSYAVTPMIGDILAMQALYGLSGSTRSGDTVYGNNSTADNPVYNATLYPNVAVTIFDTGGIDTLDYSGFSTNQTINLMAETFSSVGLGRGNLMIARGVTIENAIGGSGNDLLIGNSSNNVLNGGQGNDTASYVNSFGAVRVDLSVVGPQYVGPGGTDTLLSIENLTGSNFNDTLTGDGNANILTGLAGSDNLNGGAGNDWLIGGDWSDVLNGGEGDDILDGGVGYDIADYRQATQGVRVDLSILGPQDTGGAGIDTLISVSSVYGSAFDDILTGDNSEYNWLYGFQGNDVLSGSGNIDFLFGNEGNDYLDGGEGDDHLEGGTGDDIYVVDSSGDIVTEAFGEGTDSVRASSTYALGGNVENLTLTGTALTGFGNGEDNVLSGNAEDNSLYGGDGDDFIYGLIGADTLDGGGGVDIMDGGVGADLMTGGFGDDTYIIDNVGDQAIELAGEGTDSVRASITYTLGANVENLTLTGTAAIKGTGNALNNTIVGNSGANLLDGGAGADMLSGGLGDDNYIVDNTGDQVIESSGGGTDLVKSSVSFTLGANVENLALQGTAAINGTGNALNNNVSGNSGANVLDGGAGTDKMVGGLGNDTYIVDNTGDQVVESGSGGIDLVKSSVSFTLGASVENLNLTGNAAINGTGNALNNYIQGNNSANILVGGGGLDTLRGGGGADTFVFRDGDFAGLSPSTSDRILDFRQVEGDHIDLSAVDANTTLGGDQAFAFIGTDAFHYVAGELRYQQLNGITYVYGDTDGDGNADFLIRLDGLHSLNSGDFVI